MFYMEALEETIGATEDWFGDQNLAVGYSSQRKTRTQDDGGPLQEAATAIEPVTQRAFPTDTITTFVGDQARHSATGHETEAATPGYQEDTQRDPQAYHRNLVVWSAFLISDLGQLFI
jgi:hypothetical protein